MYFLRQVEHLMSNVFSFSNLIQDWLGFSEAIANVIQEEEF